MRKWCVKWAMGVLFALSIRAQQKVAGNPTRNKTAESANAVPAGDFSIAPASPSLFAMPAPAAKPADVFSDWSNNPWNRHAWGQLTPRFEVAGMFSYINFCPCAFRNFNEFGATGSFAYNVSRWLGIVGEVGGYRFDRQGLCLDPHPHTQNTATHSAQ